MEDDTQMTEDFVVLHALSPSSSSSSYNATIVPITTTFSPDDDEPKRKTVDDHHPVLANGDHYDDQERCLVIEKLRFLGTSSNGGMEWNHVENRFDRLALHSDGSSDEPVVKWSDFGFCIGNIINK